MDPPLGVADDSPGVVELAGFVAASAPAGERAAVERELLDAAVAIFADVNMALAVELEAVRIRHFAGGRARFSPQELQLPVIVEDLHTMIARVGDPDTPSVVDVEALRTDELPRLIAVRAPLQDEAAVVRELLDAIVFAVFADVVVALFVLHRVGDEAELARSMPIRAADLTEQLALGRIDEELKIVRIGDKQIAVAIEVQAGRAASVVGRSFPLVEKVAVGVEHLDPGRHIDDVEPIAGIDGDRPRLPEASL